MYAAEDAFSAPLLVLTLVTTLEYVHAAGNLINTLYDFERGLTRRARRTRRS